MSTSAKSATSARLWIAGYFVATFGSGLLAKTGVIPGWPGIALFLASFLLLFPLVRSVQRAQAECGMNSKAMRAYNRRVVVASMVYVAALFGTMAFARYYAPPPAARIILAIIVATSGYPGTLSSCALRLAVAASSKRSSAASAGRC